MPPSSRIDRDMTSRAADARPEKWIEASSLPDPHPSDEYDYRWVRISSYGVSDPRNLSQRMRVGWMPVSPSDCPEVALLTPNEATSTGSIDMGGHRLCRMTKRRAALGRAHYQEITDAQSAAVKRNIQSGGPNQDLTFKNEVRDNVVRGSLPFGNGE